jgi:lysophospholipase L1-like esterase
MEPKRPRTKARKLSMAAVIATVALVVLELVCWPLAPKRMDAKAEQARNTETAMRGSDLLGWELVPGESRAFGVTRPTLINELGTRNPPPQPKQIGTFRIITLGDSSVYGVMVEDAEVFSSVTARDLQHALGRPVEVINGGVPGYSSEQARRLYTHRLADLQPDVVVIATLWSDSQPGPAPDALRFGPEGNPVQSVMRWSNTYRLLEGMLLGWREGQPVEWTLRESKDGRRVPLKAYKHNLATLAELAESAGATPVFLVLPSDRDLGPTALEAPRPKYRAAMKAAATRPGAILVEMPAHFHGLSADHFFDDVHPTPKGHAIIGRHLARGISKQFEGQQR